MGVLEDFWIIFILVLRVKKGNIFVKRDLVVFNGYLLMKRKCVIFNSINNN